MAEDTFTMADVEAINLETPEPAPAEEAKAADTEPKGEAGESGTEGLKSFAEAFNEALAGIGRTPKRLRKSLRRPPRSQNRLLR